MTTVFTWVPSYGSAVTKKPSVTATKFGDGYEQRIAEGINTTPRKWQLSFTSKPNAVADAIDDFLNARNAREAFIWTPTHGTAGKWVCREWSVQQTGPFTRSVQATFDEVFEA